MLFLDVRDEIIESLRARERGKVKEMASAGQSRALAKRGKRDLLHPQRSSCKTCYRSRAVQLRQGLSLPVEAGRNVKVGVALPVQGPRYFLRR